MHHLGKGGIVVWLFLAILSFLAGLVYLFYVLKRLEKFLSGQTDAPPKKETPTVACTKDSGKMR